MRGFRKDYEVDEDEELEVASRHTLKRGGSSRQRGKQAPVRSASTQSLKHVKRHKGKKPRKEHNEENRDHLFKHLGTLVANLGGLSCETEARHALEKCYDEAASEWAAMDSSAEEDAADEAPSSSHPARSRGEYSMATTARVFRESGRKSGRGQRRGSQDVFAGLSSPRGAEHGGARMVEQQQAVEQHHHHQAAHRGGQRGSHQQAMQQRMRSVSSASDAVMPMTKQQVESRTLSLLCDLNKLDLQVLGQQRSRDIMERLQETGDLLYQHTQSEGGVLMSDFNAIRSLVDDIRQDLLLARERDSEMLLGVQNLCALLQPLLEPLLTTLVTLQMHLGDRLARMQLGNWKSLLELIRSGYLSCVVKPLVDLLGKDLLVVLSGTRSTSISKPEPLGEPGTSSGDQRRADEQLQGEVSNLLKALGDCLAGLSMSLFASMRRIQNIQLARSTVDPMHGRCQSFHALNRESMEMRDLWSQAVAVAVSCDNLLSSISPPKVVAYADLYHSRSLIFSHAVKGLTSAVRRICHLETLIPQFHNWKKVQSYLDSCSRPAWGDPNTPFIDEETVTYTNWLTKSIYRLHSLTKDLLSMKVCHGPSHEGTEVGGWLLAPWPPETTARMRTCGRIIARRMRLLRCTWVGLIDSDLKVAMVLCSRPSPRSRSTLELVAQRCKSSMVFVMEMMRSPLFAGDVGLDEGWSHQIFKLLKPVHNGVSDLLICISRKEQMGASAADAAATTASRATAASRASTAKRPPAAAAGRGGEGRSAAVAPMPPQPVAAPPGTEKPKEAGPSTASKPCADPRDAPPHSEADAALGTAQKQPPALASAPAASSSPIDERAQDMPLPEPGGGPLGAAANGPYLAAALGIEASAFDSEPRPPSPPPTAEQRPAESRTPPAAAQPAAVVRVFANGSVAIEGFDPNAFDMDAAALAASLTSHMRPLLRAPPATASSGNRPAMKASRPSVGAGATFGAPPAAAKRAAEPGRPGQAAEAGAPGKAAALPAALGASCGRCKAPPLLRQDSGLEDGWVAVTKAEHAVCPGQSGMPVPTARAMPAPAPAPAPAHHALLQGEAQARSGAVPVPAAACHSQGRLQPDDELPPVAFGSPVQHACGNAFIALGSSGMARAVPVTASAWGPPGRVVPALHRPDAFVVRPAILHPQAQLLSPSLPAVAAPLHALPDSDPLGDELFGNETVPLDMLEVHSPQKRNASPMAIASGYCGSQGLPNDSASGMDSSGSRAVASSSSSQEATCSTCNGHILPLPAQSGGGGSASLEGASKSLKFQEVDGLPGLYVQQPPGAASGSPAPPGTPTRPGAGSSAGPAASSNGAAGVDAVALGRSPFDNQFQPLDRLHNEVTRQHALEHGQQEEEQRKKMLRQRHGENVQFERRSLHGHSYNVVVGAPFELVRHGEDVDLINPVEQAENRPVHPHVLLGRHDVVIFHRMEHVNGDEDQDLITQQHAHELLRSALTSFRDHNHLNVTFSPDVIKHELACMGHSLGSGSFAQVFEMFKDVRRMRPHQPRRVAKKPIFVEDSVIHPGLVALRAVHHFIREVNTLARCRNIPFTCHIYSVSHCPVRRALYIVMDCATSCQLLKARMQAAEEAHKPLLQRSDWKSVLRSRLLQHGLQAPVVGLVLFYSWKLRMQLLCQIALALTRMQDLGLLHRDLTSFNIMLHTPEGAIQQFQTSISQAQRIEDVKLQIEPRIIDFNMSRAGGSSGDMVNSERWHSPNYMPHESGQVGKAIDLRYDVYSFACVVWELFTLTKPWENDNEWRITELLRRNEHLPLPQRSDLTPRLPDAIGYEELCYHLRKCFDKESKRRPPMQDVLRLLQRQVHALNGA